MLLPAGNDLLQNVHRQCIQHSRGSLGGSKNMLDLIRSVETSDAHNTGHCCRGDSSSEALPLESRMLPSTRGKSLAMEMQVELLLLATLSADPRDGPAMRTPQRIHTFTARDGLLRCQGQNGRSEAIILRLRNGDASASGEKPKILKDKLR